jgi:hypothetical protein
MTPSLSAAPLVVTSEAAPFAAELVAVNSSEMLTFRKVHSIEGTINKSQSSERDSLRRVRFDDFVRWGHPQPPRPQILIVLSDGGRIATAAAWAGRAPLRLDGDSVIALTDIWDEQRLPLEQVLGVVFAQRNHPQERERLEKLVRNGDLAVAASDSPDSVLLTNKDRLSGKLKSLSGESLDLTLDAGAVKLPLSRVEAIVFGSTRDRRAKTRSESRRGQIAVGFRDGSLLYAQSVAANDKNSLLVTAGGLHLEGGNVNDITFLQSPGGEFVYLSDLEPADYRHVPYLSIEWPYHRDANILGEPLAVHGKRYLKGIGMHSAARLTYRLEGKYRRFDAAVAVDDSAHRRGSVTFGAYVLRDGQWKEASASGIVRGGEEPRPISVDVSGANGLMLTVDFADRGDELDRANWLDARLIQ